MSTHRSWFSANYEADDIAREADLDAQWASRAYSVTRHVQTAGDHTTRAQAGAAQDRERGE